MDLYRSCKQKQYFSWYNIKARSGPEKLPQNNIREKQLLVPAVGALMDSTVVLEGPKKDQEGTEPARLWHPHAPALILAPKSHFPDNHYPHPDEVILFSTAELEGESVVLPRELPHIPRHAASLDSHQQLRLRAL